MKVRTGIMVLFFLIACQKPAELNIPEEKMIDVLVDMHLAEAAMQRLTKRVKDTVSQTYYQQIYEIHDLSEEEYLKNLKALERNPKLAKKVYDAVLERIIVEENKH